MTDVRTPRELADKLVADFPVNHPQFRQQVPPLCDQYYLVRQAGSPKIGIAFLNKLGQIESLGVASGAEHDRFCQDCGGLAPAPKFRPMTPDTLMNATMPFYFGPRVEFGEGLGGTMVAKLIDW